MQVKLCLMKFALELALQLTVYWQNQWYNIGYFIGYAIGYAIGYVSGNPIFSTIDNANEVVFNEICSWIGFTINCLLAKSMV